MTDDIIRLAKLPEGKIPRSEAAPVEWARVRSGVLKEEFPLSSYRLAYLKDRDNQFNTLLDYLESKGVPMGSDEWAKSALCLVRYLSEVEHILCLIVFQEHPPGGPDLEDMRLRLEHARAMHSKLKPKAGLSCDCCGWEEPTVRCLGQTALCEDCLPKFKNEINDKTKT